MNERVDYVLPELDPDNYAKRKPAISLRISKLLRDAQKRLNDKDGNFQADTQAGTWYHGPAAMLTKIHITEENWMHQYVFELPVDEFTIKVFLVNMRNCLLEDHYGPKVEERCMVIAKQDIVVLEQIEPKLTPAGLTKEIMMPADKIVVKYREALKKWDANGWRIDTATMKANKHAFAYAIPSPARRDKKGWPVDAIPLIRPDASKKAAAE